jgi:hypothetical protein
MQSRGKWHTSTRTSSSSTGSGTDSWTTDFLETDFLGVADVLFLGAALFFSATGLSTLTSASRSTDGSGVFSLSSSSMMLARLARVDELARVDLCGPGNYASVLPPSCPSPQSGLFSGSIPVIPPSRHPQRSAKPPAVGFCTRMGSATAGPAHSDPQTTPLRRMHAGNDLRTTIF